jgi:hypothetical protein
MESIYHIVTIRVNETSWAHVWRLHSCYLGTGYGRVLLVLLYWPGKGTPGRGRGNWPTVIALTPLMVGRLDEGLRSEIKGGGNQGVE